MTEKDLDSMTTVQIKPEYAASEVYSTTSEPPPAYKRQSSSVQIARIVAFTVIVSSVIIGVFILASAYLQAKASCDQVQALDSVLEKELMLEAFQQVNKELPRAEALIGKEGNSDESDLQNIDNEEPIKKEEEAKQEKEVPVPSTNENDQETDSSFSDNEEDYSKSQNVPLELDLTDLAAALLENNQKSRMNCVVERKRAEEFIDTPSKTMQLPFGMNITTDPKKAKITGERISIFCETGEEEKRQEDAEQIPPLFFPIQRIPISFGAPPQQVPLTHMPQRMPQQPMMNGMPPRPMVHQMPPPFHQIPIRIPVPMQDMQAPPPEPQIRVQVHHFQLPQNMARIPLPSQNNNQMPQIQIQKVPLNVALQDGDITMQEFRAIERLSEEQDTSEQMSDLNKKIREELLRFVPQHAFSSVQIPDSSEDESQSSDTSAESSQSQSNEQPTLPAQPPQLQETLHPPMNDPKILQIGRVTSGRSLLTPVAIPVPMMSHESSDDYAEPERRHVVQPRSIKDDASIPETRVKRYACDCKC